MLLVLLPLLLSLLIMNLYILDDMTIISRKKLAWGLGDVNKHSWENLAVGKCDA